LVNRSNATNTDSARPHDALRIGAPAARGGLARAAWIGLAIAVASLIAVVAVVAGLWAAIGDSEISAGGWVAMIFGVVMTLALGIGLMSLVFFSSRHGYDEGTGGVDRGAE
jgi:fatty acid desaturase